MTTISLLKAAICSSRSIYQMLIDDMMPLYQFNEVQSIMVRSNTRSSIFNAVMDVTPKEIPFLIELFWLRAIIYYSTQSHH
jgi:hypothetical protein